MHYINLSKARFERELKKLSRLKEDVSFIQNKLTENGYTVNVTGEWDDATHTSIYAFQKANNLKADGIVGEHTLEKLNQSIKPISHFSAEEFRCPCCNELPEEGIDPELLQRLEVLRKEIGDRPIHIKSGYRCPKHNTEVGGVKHSQHMFGKAADIYVRGMSPAELGKVADKVFHDGGVGLGGASIVHVDVRGKRARWSYN